MQIASVHIPPAAPMHHSAITQYMTSVGVVWNKPELISWLQISGNTAFVQDRNGDVVYCEVIYPISGNPYVKTRPDGIIADNLLSLPRF